MSFFSSILFFFFFKDIFLTSVLTTINTNYVICLPAHFINFYGPITVSKVYNVIHRAFKGSVLLKGGCPPM